jgi:hypothetical protein
MWWCSDIDQWGASHERYIYSYDKYIYGESSGAAGYDGASVRLLKN